MQSRLDQINVEVYLLDELLDDAMWEQFTAELFHFTLRVT